jgi:Family of unknown function (DUF5309)
MAIGLISDMAQGQTLQEDVVDAIYNVDYKSTPFMSRIGESVATNTLHSWLVDTYAAPGLNANAESADAVVVDAVNPTRRSNIVQLFRKVITVSDTELALPNYGMNDPFEYQTQKRMVELARDMELAAVAGTRASGSSGVARQADGAIALITTNKTAQTSGTCFTEAILLSLLSGVYTGGTDEDVDLLLTGAYLKLAIDKFATNTTRYIDATAFEQALRVDTYMSSFGIHKVCLSRQVPSGSILGVDTSKWRTAWLVNRRVAIKPLGKTGSSTKALMEGEATWEALNEKSSFYASGFFFG